MNNQEKDKDLGIQIQQLLIKQAMENPILPEKIAKWDHKAYAKSLEKKLSVILSDLGFDLDNDSLEKTPYRVIKFWMNELFYGLNYNNFPKITLNRNTFNYNYPLISRGISLHSTCEHHLVLINGEVVIGYIPKNFIIGLSKLNRIVDFFARRPQVQERLTQQIFIALKHILQTTDVAVVVFAKHNCILARGVKDINTTNVTYALGGQFLNDEALRTKIYNMQFD